MKIGKILACLADLAPIGPTAHSVLLLTEIGWGTLIESKAALEINRKLDHVHTGKGVKDFVTIVQRP